MRVKALALASFKSKLLKPCKKLLPIFTFKLKKPLFIRPSRPRNTQASKSPRNRVARLFRGLYFRDRKKTSDMDRLVELKSFSERGSDAMLLPSPLTPAYLKAARDANREAYKDVEDVEDSCRTFENYLVEMIVEEGKLKDLADVEELLYCWRNLKCPVFIDLVSRFYGDLCKDLFSGEADEADDRS